MFPAGSSSPREQWCGHRPPPPRPHPPKDHAHDQPPGRSSASEVVYLSCTCRAELLGPFIDARAFVYTRHLRVVKAGTHQKGVREHHGSWQLRLRIRGELCQLQVAREKDAIDIYNALWSRVYGAGYVADYQLPPGEYNRCVQSNECVPSVKNNGTVYSLWDEVTVLSDGFG